MAVEHLNMASVTEELGLKFYEILIKFNRAFGASGYCVGQRRDCWEGWLRASRYSVISTEAFPQGQQNS